MLQYNESNPVGKEWGRTEDSLVEEWIIHNFAFKFYIKRKHTADCDFNRGDEGKGIEFICENMPKW